MSDAHRRRTSFDYNLAPKRELPNRSGFVVRRQVTGITIIRGTCGRSGEDRSTATGKKRKGTPIHIPTENAPASLGQGAGRGRRGLQAGLRVRTLLKINPLRKIENSGAGLFESTPLRRQLRTTTTPLPRGLNPPHTAVSGAVPLCESLGTPNSASVCFFMNGPQWLPAAADVARPPARPPGRARWRCIRGGGRDREHVTGGK